MKVTYYALLEKQSNKIIIRALNAEHLEKRIDVTYWDRRSLRPKGTEYTKEDFLEGKFKATVTIEECA